MIHLVIRRSRRGLTNVAGEFSRFKPRRRLSDKAAKRGALLRLVWSVVDLALLWNWQFRM